MASSTRTVVGCRIVLIAVASTPAAVANGPTGPLTRPAAEEAIYLGVGRPAALPSPSCRWLGRASEPDGLRQGLARTFRTRRQS